MNSITALIIDDEYLARFTLRKKLTDFSEIYIIGEAGSIREAKEKIESLHPQLLFLDIQLPDGSGFDLINIIEFSGKIVFVTAYDEYALRAFEINAIDYLLKPISVKRLKNAIEKLHEIGNRVESGCEIKFDYNDRLMVMYKKSVNFIKINDIVCITASREHCYIHAIDGKEYLTSKNISEWENRLPDQNFCRIHRSTIINFDFILNLVHNYTGTAEVLLQGINKPLPVSRNYFRKLKGRYSL